MGSIMSKIKNFFISLFNNKKKLSEPNENMEASLDSGNKNSENSAFAKMKEDARLLDLEKQLVKGEINEEQMDKEDVEKLRELLLSKKKGLEKQLDSYAKKIYDILSKDEKFLDEYRKYDEGLLNEKNIDDNMIVKFKVYKKALELL